MSPKESAKPYPCDAPLIADGGRVKLLGDVRTWAEWPAGTASYEIIVELIEPGWVELHIRARADHRLQKAREWVQGLPAAQRGTRAQGVEDIFQEATFDPEDGRLQIPPAVLAFLGVFPAPSEGDEKINPGATAAMPRKRKPLARYGGQQLFVQANDNSITVMSMARRLARFQALDEELPPDLRTRD
jgi:hypothetical protein